MMLGARTAAWAKSGVWVNPYVTEGLVIFYDGRWNEGPGLHNDSLPIMDWANLAGENILLSPYKDLEYDWGDMYCQRITNSVGSITCKKPFDIDHNPFTLELFIRGGFVLQFMNIIAYDSALRAHYSDGYQYVGGNAYLPISKFGLSMSYDGVGNTIGVRNGIVQTNLANKVLDSYGASFRIMGRDSGGGNGSRLYTLRLYDRVLTSEEVTNNWNVDVSRFGLT